MKLVLLSDVHLSWHNPVARLDDVREVQLKKLGFVLDWACRNGAAVLQAGDLFDRPRSWYLLPRVITLLNVFNLDYCPLFAVFGQHDTYMHSEVTRRATSLGVLAEAGLVKILGSRPEMVYPDVCLYGASFGEKVPRVDESLGDVLNVLVIHAPIGQKQLFPGQDYVYNKRFLALHEQFDLVLCGDIHRLQVIEASGRWLVNTGPMVRRTADRYNFSYKPCFFVYDTEKRDLEMIEIPHEPAEKVLSREHIESREESERMLEEFVSSLKQETEVDVGTDFKANLERWIEENDLEQEVVNIISEVMADADSE
jgi:DNA repair exonuclease SbcCD nuclease subunit